MLVLQIIALLLVAAIETGPVAAQKNWRTCKAYGDMHLETFDGATFDYQGVCKLKLVDFCGGSSATTLPTFQVSMRGEHRYGSSEVSYAEYVEIVYGGKTIRMARNPVNNTVDVTENGVPIPVPTITPTYTVVADALYTIYRGPPDLDVRYNGDSTVWVILLTNYAENSMCGACGNYNYDPTDDYVTQDGKDVSTNEEMERGKQIGDSWIVASDPEQQDQSKCPASIPSPCMATGDWVARCNGLIDTSTQFVRTINCLGLGFMEKLRDSCLMDGCYSDGAAVQHIFDYLRDAITIDFPQCAGCETGGACAVRHTPGTRIINGDLAAANARPWQCRLRYMDKTGLDAHFCGCSVLSANWVVTAAHCMVAEERTNVQVVAGDLDILATDNSEQVRTVRRIEIHSSYNVPTEYNNDIALVELCDPLTLNAGVQAIEMATTDFINNETCYASGWGYTAAGGPDKSQFLRDVQLTIVDTQTCQQIQPTMTGNMLCAGYEANKDTCTYDSGGPLACWVNGTSKWALVGITSFDAGAGCNGSGTGIYTRVASYSQTTWLQNLKSAPGAVGECSCPSLLHENVLIWNNCTHYCDCYCGFGIRTPCPSNPDPNIEICVNDTLVPYWRRQECGMV